jgi:hypothetical protein
VVEKVTIQFPGSSEPVVIKRDVLLSEESTCVSEEDFFKEPVYGVESANIGLESFDCDVHYSVEKFFGNEKDNEAPPAGKIKVGLAGFLNPEVTFSDGSKAKNDVNAVFASPYVKGKIKEFNDYYITQKGFKPLIQDDLKTLKMDIAQILSKIVNSTLIDKIQIKFFDGAAIYGAFTYLLGNVIAKDKVLLAPQIPFCIVYTKTDENGKKRVLARRFLVVGCYSKRITDRNAHAQSGGKEIGTVK